MIQSYGIICSLIFWCLLGHSGGGFRRNSVSDGADSLSRSASDSSVSNPGGSSMNNTNNKSRGQGNGGAMGNGSSNGLG